MPSTNKAFNARFPRETHWKIADLAKRWECSLTQAVATAVDMAHLGEIPTAQPVEAMPVAEQPVLTEWIDRGERWDEITGEMVHVEQHYRTGRYRPVG